MGKLFVVGAVVGLSIASPAAAQRRCPDPAVQVSVPLAGASGAAGAAGAADAELDVEAVDGAGGVATGAVAGVGGAAAGGLGGLGIGGGAPEVGSPEVDSPNVDAPRLDAPGDLDADPEVEADTGLSPWFWVAGVVGAVAVIGGITATIVHGNLSSDFEALGCDGPTPGPMCEDLDADVSLASGFQVGGFVLGGVALVGAGLIFALSGSADADEELELDCQTEVVARTAPTTAVCSPFASPDGAGAACALTF